MSGAPDPRQNDLARSAAEARTRAHAPHSGFLVGAALLLADGTVVTGCNVECSSYGLTICAERVAATRAIAEGHAPSDFVAIAVAGERPVPPCGACRQFLHDLAPDLDVVVSAGGEVDRVVSMRELLPDAFDGSFLDQL